MGLIIGICILIFIIFIISKTLSFDNVTGKNIKKYVLYIVALITIVILFFIIKN
jgi:hypothetical protein